jgi:hypothetical protein
VLFSCEVVPEIDLLALLKQPADQLRGYLYLAALAQVLVQLVPELPRLLFGPQRYHPVVGDHLDHAPCLGEPRSRAPERPPALV